MMGWSRHDYICETQVDHQTLTSLAGNAFSAYSIAPLLMSAMMVMCTGTHHDHDTSTSKRVAVRDDDVADLHDFLEPAIDID